MFVYAGCGNCMSLARHCSNRRRTFAFLYPHTAVCRPWAPSLCATASAAAASAPVNQVWHWPGLAKPLLTSQHTADSESDCLPCRPLNLQ